MKYNLLRASSYINFPKELQNPKKGSVNIQNYADEKCFIWSLLTLFNPTSRRIRKCIRYKGELDIQGITYLESVRNNNQFEKQNPDIPINVYGYEYEKVFPLRITQERDRQHHVNHLQVTDQTKNAHFELVKNKFFAKDAVF